MEDTKFNAWFPSGLDFKNFYFDGGLFLCQARDKSK